MKEVFDRIEQFKKDMKELGIEVNVSITVNLRRGNVSVSPAAQIPDLDLAEINELPWKAKNKEPAKPGKWGWILSDVDKHAEEHYALVERLNHAIVRAKGNLELGEYTFSFSGAKSQFINRKPRKL